MKTRTQIDSPLNGSAPAPALRHPSLPLAGLRYVDDQGPGIRRRRIRGKFQYFDEAGRRIEDEATIARINALAIPPGYQNVWICPDEHGHIQATARDVRGRKQYRYHEQWTAIRDATKYQQLREFGEALPRIRRQVKRDIQMPGLCRQKVLAVVVQLLELTLIRVGTREYARTNKSYGLTTLRRMHAQVAGHRIRLRFKGKSGVQHDVTINNRRIACVVKRCMEIPGQQLFLYLDEEGAAHAVDSESVNDYLRQAGAGDFTAKHYRTWAGSVFAIAKLQRQPRENQTAAKHKVAEVVKEVAKRLGNTPAVCRACYIHPDVIQFYLEGKLPPRVSLSGPKGLNADEKRLLAFLRDRLS